MYRRLSLSLMGSALVVLSGVARAECANMLVIVRNTVYPIHGLDAFCTEFNKMKAEMAGLRSELSIARRENVALEARLEALSPGSEGQALASTAPLGRGSNSGMLSR